MISHRQSIIRLLPYDDGVLIAVHVELEPFVTATVRDLRDGQCDLGTLVAHGDLAQVVVALGNLHRHLLRRLGIDAVGEINLVIKALLPHLRRLVHLLEVEVNVVFALVGFRGLRDGQRVALLLREGCLELPVLLTVEALLRAHLLTQGLDIDLAERLVAFLIHPHRAVEGKHQNLCLQRHVDYHAVGIVHLLIALVQHVHDIGWNLSHGACGNHQRSNDHY